MKPTNKWLNKILPMYREAVNHFEFCKTFKLEWSEDAINAYYEYESYGVGNNINLNNGCARGKFLIDLHIQLWRDGIKEKLFNKQELTSDLPDILKPYFYKAL